MTRWTSRWAKRYWPMVQFPNEDRWVDRRLAREELTRPHLSQVKWQLPRWYVARLLHSAVYACNGGMIRRKRAPQPLWGTSNGFVKVHSRDLVSLCWEVLKLRRALVRKQKKIDAMEARTREPARKGEPRGMVGGAPLEEYV